MTISVNLYMMLNMCKGEEMNKNLRMKIFHKYDEHCAYCGNTITYSQMQVDHIKPKYLGGKDNIENLRPSCRACNFYKQTLDEEKFRQRIKDIPKQLNRLFIFRLALKYGIVELKDKEIKFKYEDQK